MSNTKQAKKMVRKTERQTQHNNWWKSKIRTSLKNIDSLIEKNASKEEISAEFKKLQKTVDKAVKTKVIKPNKANRVKSSTNKKIKNRQPKSTEKKTTKQK